jgi:hypothetical protein
MPGLLKPTHTRPGGLMMEADGSCEDGLFNDSMGTVDLADSTGDDDELETGDAKFLNLPTRED